MCTKKSVVDVQDRPIAVQKRVNGYVRRVSWIYQITRFITPVVIIKTSMIKFCLLRKS